MILAVRAEELLHTALLYDLFGTHQLRTSLKSQASRLRAAAPVLRPELGVEIEFLTAHAEIILVYKDMADVFIEEIISMPVAVRIDDLFECYRVYHNKLLSEVNIYRIILYSGSLLLLVYIVHLLVRLKRAALDLEEANETLEFNVAERTAELESEIGVRQRAEKELVLAKEQAEAGSLAKSRFLANMSHELRTPLNAILGYTELIVDKVYGEVPSKISAIVERIGTNGDHLLGLISDILDLSKIEAGQFSLILDDYSMKHVVDMVMSSCEGQAADKALALSINTNRPRV